MQIPLVGSDSETAAVGEALLVIAYVVAGRGRDPHKASVEIRSRPPATRLRRHCRIVYVVVGTLADPHLHLHSLCLSYARANSLPCQLNRVASGRPQFLAHTRCIHPVPCYSNAIAAPKCSGRLSRRWVHDIGTESKT